jgi:hypothetical protein
MRCKETKEKRRRDIRKREKKQRDKSINSVNKTGARG